MIWGTPCENWQLLMVGRLRTMYACGITWYEVNVFKVPHNRSASVSPANRKSIQNSIWNRLKRIIGASKPPVEPQLSGLLTRREWEIAHLAAQGLTNRQIAERLVIAPLTVKTHLQNIFAKLDVHSREA